MSIGTKRYDRNFDTLTRPQQAQLASSRVAVLGLGGLGGGVSEMLARTGVGHLTLIDGDVFEPSNLNRQLFCTEEVLGISKALAAEKRIRAVNSQVQVTSIDQYADGDNLYGMIKHADLVVDCLDSIPARFMLEHAAKKAQIPLVAGAIAGVTGQVTVIFPQDKGYELIYGKKEHLPAKGIESRTGNISYCALMVAALQASECIKVLLDRGDILRNKLLIMELWSNSFEVMDLV
ncbi:HesA/MoeB/ThiF family protein [Desulfotignum phosphitoxidans]|uniref:Molybdopterin/thiamine biosynthesis protein MoeB n=1 Tax=Desulfotignum phosphitoxidans DSM 13687 TaxID=1286635 RepID=S0G5S2_9BACT|nr:HesA/MoeB/ThiF family protein [Desulfotignum phosphitoxidans]EMS79917.1 molybdopterin/thiamine biosynthesis protein MoeB [Desulfotignum phosphitoxidans DSM 13687]